MPRTGIEPVICGDAHLGNFGFYASPERDLVFDLNDFDEAHPGPWEWDMWRLATSIWVAGRQNGLAEGTCEDAVCGARRRTAGRSAGSPSSRCWPARSTEWTSTGCGLRWRTGPCERRSSDRRTWHATEPAIVRFPS